MEVPKDTYSCVPSEKNTQLIGEVKKFPSLYDTSDPNYYVLAERNKAWLQVAENCSEPAEFCHLRWKSLRKRYAKERRKIPEILQGHRRPWALFPKMAFLASSTLKGRGRAQIRKKLKSDQTLLQKSKPAKSLKLHNSDDDMLILDDNDEIVTTCKSVDMAEEGEDEYIYETLDDPDSALAIMKDNATPSIKPTAIRSGVSTNSLATVRNRGSGRIRKVTSKMQNSFIAKKLKQAQQVIQNSSASTNNIENKVPVSKISTLPTESKTVPTVSNNSKTNFHNEKHVLYQDKTTRHIATVNPNIIRVEKLTETNQSLKISEKSQSSGTQDRNISVQVHEKSVTESPGKPKPQFKVVKLKGRNPIIFPPNELPNFQSFLKADQSPTKEQSKTTSPVIKVKSVDNLNQSTTSNENNERNNLDIIHSVGLVRKNNVAKPPVVEKIPHQSYSRAYSWNRPAVPKVVKKPTAEKVVHPDSQTNDYEIEESWNDIKQENMDDTSWTQYPPMMEDPLVPEVVMNCPESPTSGQCNGWNKVMEAKLELVAFQRKILEEQHKKNLEYMKKEHDLKMTLLKSEIDLKRKQFSLMV